MEFLNSLSKSSSDPTMTNAVDQSKEEDCAHDSSSSSSSSSSTMTTTSGSSVGVSEGESKSSNESKPAPDEKEKKKYTEMLYEAIKATNLTMIQLVLAKDETTVNRPFTHVEIEWPPLALACARGSVSVVEILLRIKCIDVNEARNSDGLTALHLGSDNGYTDVVKLLLGAEGINVNQEDHDGLTALSAASQLGNSEVVKLLLGVEGINVNQADEDGETALFSVSENGHLGVVKLLLWRRINLLNIISNTIYNFQVIWAYT